MSSLKPIMDTSLTFPVNNQADSDNESYRTNFMCRICHCEEPSEEYLISPCYCSGTLQYVHQSCLQQWLKSNGIKSCELCKYAFVMSYETRPFKNWEKLDMNSIEIRKILCSVTFHVIALTCVVWSLYVLIDRTAEEGRMNQFDWSFWTKLVVVAIGFTGGVIFMYIQCKMYIQLCNRWRQYNRIIIIQPITDEIIKKSKKKILEDNSRVKFVVSDKITNSSNKNLLEEKSDSKQQTEVNSTLGVTTEESSMLIMNNLIHQTNEESTNINNQSVLNLS